MFATNWIFFKIDLPRETANTGHSSRLAESGRLVRRMSHRVDPAAIAEEARTVRLDAVLGPPRRVRSGGGYSSTPESRTLLYSGGGGQALSG